MTERSFLDDIDDHNYTVDKLVYEDNSEKEVYRLLEKKGLDKEKILELINNVKEEYNGIDFYKISRLRSIFILVFDYTLFFLIILINIELPKVYKSLSAEVYFGLLVSIYFMYFMGFESLWGSTIGAYFAGCRIVDENFQKPSILKILFRTILRLVPNALGIKGTIQNTFIQIHTINYRKYENRNNKLRDLKDPNF
jgi:hypothetical protein